MKKPAIMIFEKNYTIERLLIFLIVFFPLVLHLDSAPIRIWDESLFGLRAIHLAETGSFMPNFNVFDQVPSHINTKLPFTSMFQVLAFKLFGYSELSMRLPIVLIIIFMLIVVVKWLTKIEKNRLLGYLFAIVLISSTGWMENHIARSGDHDAAFASYIMLGLISFFIYVESTENENHKKFLWFFTFSIIAALLTKNILAFAFLPGLVIYIIYRKKLLFYIKKPDFYMSIGIMLFVFFGTLLYLNFKNPGLIQRMWDYELFGRYTNTIESHKGSFLFYFDSFMQEKFLPWIYFIPFSWFIIFRKTEKTRLRNFSIFLNISLISIFLFLSLSKTKTPWYAATLYPVMSLIVAVGLFDVIIALWNVFSKQTTLKYLLIYGLLLLFGIPYAKVIDKDIKPVYLLKQEKLGLVLRKADHEKPDFKKISLINSDSGTNAAFYAKAYNNKSKSYDFRVKRKGPYAKGEHVIVCTNKDFDPIKASYDFEIILQEDVCFLLKIKGKKNEK